MAYKLKRFQREIRACLVAGLVMTGSALGGAAYAGTDFGSDEDVKAMAAKLVEFVKANGTDAAVVALKDGSSEFGSAKPGLMIWVDNKMGAHNKFPDLSDIDFASMQDLRGRFVIKEFTAAADKGGDYSLNYWPHYTTEAEYEYHCFSTWIEKPRVMATACR